MKKLLLILLCVPLIYSCGDEKILIDQLEFKETDDYNAYFKGKLYSGFAYGVNDGTNFEIEIIDGKYVFQKVYYEDSSFTFYKYLNGKNSWMKCYNQNGQLTEEKIFEEDYRIEFDNNNDYKGEMGSYLHKYYYNSGQLMLVGKVIDGNRSGLWQRYDEKGNLEKEWMESVKVNSNDKDNFEKLNDTISSVNKRIID